MDWQLAIERNGEGVARILVALAAMAGLLEAAGCRLPQNTYLAVLGPLRAAEAIARQPPQANLHNPVAVARLKLRFLVLRRAIDDLMRRLLMPAQETIRRLAHEVLADLQHFANRALEERPDTS